MNFIQLTLRGDAARVVIINASHIVAMQHAVRGFAGQLKADARTETFTRIILSNDTTAIEVTEPIDQIMLLITLGTPQ